MPVSPTYPGVYIEEIPSGVRTIVGVSTSVTAFIDFFARGPVNKPVQVLSEGDFERDFGGLHEYSEASYAISQFFQNGGSNAWVVRVPAADSKTATVTLQDDTGNSILEVTAGRQIKDNPVEDSGSWANAVLLDVDYDTDSPGTTFNLTVSEMSADGSQVLKTETYRNLSMDEKKAKYAVDVVNAKSKLVQLERKSLPSNTDRPAATGTGGGDASATATTVSPSDSFTVSGNTAMLEFTGTLTSMQEVRKVLQAAIRSAGEAAADAMLSGATVELVDNKWFRVRASRSAANYDPETVLVVTEAGGSTATDLGLLGTGAFANVQQYKLGSATTIGAQVDGKEGKDGDLPAKLPDGNALRGVRLNKTGIYALEDVDLFNILCIPRAADLSQQIEMQLVYSAAESYCQERRAFLIVDLPEDNTTIDDARDWLDDNASLRHINSAAYFPRPRVPDPLKDFRLRSVGASGTVAGLYARTDATRGVWKAPAGIDSTLRNVPELAAKLTDPENGQLNPLGLNCLRTFDVYGNVSWGARTLDGADKKASEWKYIPIRRLALYIEESLFRGTQWVVFEPNDEPLWAQIRLNVGAFMHDLFRQGAFQGKAPREAYLVKCDKETTPQSEINKGIVNIVVGFAPLKPAEFVIIKIQQLAGQIEA
jgi:phage tail sheath protein FI